jgi:hypothetical protein
VLFKQISKNIYVKKLTTKPIFLGRSKHIKNSPNSFICYILTKTNATKLNCTLQIIPDIKTCKKQVLGIHEFL